jgi:hypothetical protein
VQAEVAELERVRAAVRSGQGAAARALVASYRQKFPAGKGVLGSEAFVLEIEANALDRPAEARRMAESFLARNPSSPLANRVRRAGGIRQEPLP